MAETVKKSRIVSDDDNLEEEMMEEFNLRLKKCMSQDDLQQASKTDANEVFIRAEQENYYEEPAEVVRKQNGYHQNNVYENVVRVSDKTDPVLAKKDQYVEMTLKTDPAPVYEDIDDDPEPRVGLTLTDLSDGKENEVVKSVKDRMFLSTDDAPCLLFTQTVTSPMLTPSEENIDFLKGFRRESGDVPVTDVDEVTVTDVATTKNENHYENADFLKRHDVENIYENLKEQEPCEIIYENLKDLKDDDGEGERSEAIYQNVDQLNKECEQVEEVVESEDNLITSVTDVDIESEVEEKSSFSKFDALQKKNVLHVRSSDSSRAQEKFNGAQTDTTSNCRVCDKPVFQMEQMKAEKAVWHKNCFRCTTCAKQLNVDTYQSNEGVLYCKPHFKALFAPKAVEEEPLPSDKPDLGLEELQSLNVKERFQVFEHQLMETSDERTLSAVNVKRSPSILSKLAKFQSKGMDIGVADDSLNGIPIEESSSEEEQEEEEEGIEGEDADLIRAKRVQKERPFHFTGMSDVKSKWEQGDQHTSRDERREERKQEIQSIRNRLFMGKQGKMKEAYQQAVLESESSVQVRKEPIEICDTKSLKERFEKGDLGQEKVAREREDEDTEVFESEISKKSRSLFLELDANASKAPQLTPISTPKIDVKKAREASTPDREVPRDPEIVRSEETIEDSVVAKESHTATKMLSKFRQMEEGLSKEPQPSGPKPLKRFTPPPEPARVEESSSEAEESDSDAASEDDDDDEVDRAKVADEDLLEAQKAARAKQLRAKFERWEANEIKKEQSNVNIIEEFGEEQSQIESTKTLRARFESMRETHSETNRIPRVKVNRFVELPNITETCESCNARVYPLEKISVHNRIYHKSCFKCMECNCVLRMDSYSYNQGLLYCMPHFKRLFISKGNYDTGFGLDQHKEKWNATLA